MTSQGDFSSMHSRPTVADLNGDNHYTEVARKHWLNAAKPPKVKPTVVKDELWDKLEAEGFPYGSLLILETLQVLERYLWPGYSDASSDQHVLLLTTIINVKRRENLPAWTLFQDKPAEFSSFFRRILSMTVDLSIPLKVRTIMLSFIIGAFSSLDNGLVRKECAPLVSIALWQNLHSESAREDKLNSHVSLRKMWKSSGKRYDAADPASQAKMRFDRAWLYTLLLDFLNRVYETASGEAGKDNLLYCERFMELLIDLQSQLPTRRYVNSLLIDLNLLPALRLSPVYTDEDNGLFRDLHSLLRHYTYFPVDDQSGNQLSPLECSEARHKVLAKLQRVAFGKLEDKLKLLALSNYGALGRRDDLLSHLETLETDELVSLCEELGFKTQYPESSRVVRDRGFYLELMVARYEERPTFQESVKELTIVPTERTLYEPTFLRNETYNGSRPLAIPKLNLQYLTMGDFLWRSFILHRCESFYAIRNDVEEVIKQVRPRTLSGTTRFDGASRMALPIARPAIVEVGLPNVGELVPSIVRAEVILDVYRLAYGVRKEWESLRPNDVVFLAAAHPFSEDSEFSNGYSDAHSADRIGLRHLRAAEVIQVQDEKGKPLRENRSEDDEQYRPRQRRLILKIDAAAYEVDRQQLSQGNADIYDSINLIIRRRGRENNFKPILESIKRLTLSDVPAPSWFQGVFLGYDDPSAATYKKLSSRLKKIDYGDTFLDWQHLIESLEGKAVVPSEDLEGSFGPPYVLETSTSEPAEPEVRPSKKRRREQDGEQKPLIESVKVSTYKPPNNGPYPMDAPKRNTVRFTPTQIEAITSGTQPGLTVIVGPPGTGKTDVATQIINNIFHNFPNQRTLLIAHSNQALNQLFQKITALDIDERYLLRLGHGEEELETDVSYSKHGRVESFLERGTQYLLEVSRLAATIQAPGAHGNSCETAGYFNMVYIKPIWTQYWDSITNEELSRDEIVVAFPFHDYFSNTPGPLFPPETTRDEAVEIVRGCYRHIERIFAELEEIRPFEILRSAKDKANYLLIKEAKIIAMTSTHAAIRRQEIADLGFHYDNVIMEEAAQITEIENFIPLALQKPQNGKMPLQRVVLVGDHLQNSPIIQNLAFRQYANLEQSLFLRLVRLGVPTITLDRQGRARPSLAELYKWRYPQLTSLPVVEQSPEFQRANAGFRYDYQFIDVPDYKGRGESEPTPHFIQNVGEAEYAVAIYMYMRLLGYPASKVSILATYAGQRSLIRDVLTHRCKGNRLFGMPRIVTTVDKYQGEQNDYVILSLTRTLRPGYLRDLRRLTVALSRSRLGLYVIGRRAVFESCYELKDAFSRLFARPTTLRLVYGEFFPCERAVDAEVAETEMVSVEHIGQYVFEMTQAKIKALKEGAEALPAIEEIPNGADDDEGDVIEEDVPSEPEEPDEDLQ
ncbi:P-loop containing nucleoside triphosphate hydrolase protein [Trichodelitschia bisporula]|uniref:Pre-mRNA-splicing factor n=1 Tax=Trichodelitschia bisporula TaxID=703511 RepID=A0A6G1HQY0_9PEZI|nr:P-loop containing nucleoside triphosphate hydrolase protein [Trichodelitschia bisporula]